MVLACARSAGRESKNSLFSDAVYPLSQCILVTVITIGH
ncbi:Hypothetical protein ETEE_0967 [Edwardsiella anguillarum ET080813]|uniref:Uncharacterized protein n=1 Tax=Edwardsiella anguillarum ET080813 TaxID=667120 RepID=A0A076LL16_9GAMM|nr:Hypothetical protein ETEE_0967 [Edwardsiella anguillarum ET080813]